MRATTLQRETSNQHREEKQKKIHASRSTCVKLTRRNLYRLTPLGLASLINFSHIKMVHFIYHDSIQFDLCFSLHLDVNILDSRLDRCLDTSPRESTTSLYVLSTPCSHTPTSLFFLFVIYSLATNNFTREVRGPQVSHFSSANLP